MALTGLKSSVGMAVFLLQALGRISSLPFQLLITIHIPQLMATSQKWHHINFCFHSHISLSLQPSSSIVENLCYYIELTQIIQNNPCFKTFNLISSHRMSFLHGNKKSFLPCKETYSQILGIKTQTSLECYFSLYHKILKPKSAIC